MAKSCRTRVFEGNCSAIGLNTVDLHIFFAAFQHNNYFPVCGTSSVNIKSCAGISNSDGSTQCFCAAGV